MNLPKNAKQVFTKIDMQATELYGDMTTPCWPFTGKLNGEGRPYIQIAGKKYLAYRLTHELVYGDGCLDGLIARHKCDNQVCCRPDHIEGGTHEENMNDMNKRERHGLPHHTIRAIRKLADKKDAPTHEVIGELYGLARSTVSNIVNNDRYKHVKDKDNEDTVN